MHAFTDDEPPSTFPPNVRPSAAPDSQRCVVAIRPCGEDLGWPAISAQRPVVGPSLEQADAPVGVLAQSRSEDAPCCAATHDEDVEAHGPRIRRGRYPGRVTALDILSPRTRTWFERAFAEPTPAQLLGWPAIASGDHVLIQAPDGLGKDARCVPGRHRSAQRDARGRPAPSLRLAAQGAELRHRAEPAKPARRTRLEALGRGAHGGHACGGAAPNAADPSGHPHHHARVAVPAPHLAGTRDASRDRDRDPRRGARSRRHEARRASGALARATRAPRRRSFPAPWALGDPATDGGDRSLRRRIGPRDPARRRGRPQGAGPPGRRSGRGHARAAVDGRALCPAARRRGRDGRRRRTVEPVDLALDLPRDPRPRQSSTARRSSS